MLRLATLALGLAALLSTASCGSSPAAPTVLSLAGSWDGPGSNQLGKHMISLTVAQSGTTLSGTVTTRPVDPVGTTCASCHMSKVGTFTGTISGSTLTLSMTFPPGNAADPTPLCTTTMIVNTAVTGTSIAGPYTGTDTCEGAFIDATLSMARN